MGRVRGQNICVKFCSPSGPRLSRNTHKKIRPNTLWKGPLSAAGTFTRLACTEQTRFIPRLLRWLHLFALFLFRMFHMFRRLRRSKLSPGAASLN